MRFNIFGRVSRQDSRVGGVLRFNLESDSISLHSRAHQGNTATLGGGGGGTPIYKGRGCLSGNFKLTPKRYIHTYIHTYGLFRHG